MPLRTASADFITLLSQDLLTLALCIKITRLDAVVLGFTTYDRDLVISGVTYESQVSFDPSAIHQEVTTSVDNLEVLGMLDSAYITEDDIRAGRYDGAKIEFFIVNYEDLTDGTIIMLTGNLGEVVTVSGQFTAEVRSLMQRMKQSVGELTSPLCRVKQLGDARCKVNLAPYQFSRTVSQVNSTFVFYVQTDGHANDYFTYGRVTFTTGLNAGFQREIKDSSVISGTVHRLDLQEKFPYTVQVGDACTVEAGCDRQFATCQTKFSNVLNFRGEPHIPGTDTIIKIGRKR